MDIPKEIIRPGTYTYIHPDTNRPEKMTVTSETIKHFFNQGNAMIAAGLSVPVPIEHQPDAKPQTASEKAANLLKNNSGWVKKYEITDGRLIGVLDIQDESIIGKLPKTIRFTSPHINSFVDGDGKKWDGVISHVALTTRPRIKQQEPFAPNMAAALSLVKSLHDHVINLKSIPPIGLSLSKAGLLKDGVPQFPMAFSLYSGIQLARDEFEKVEEEEESDDEVIEDGEEDSIEDDTPESPIEAIRESKANSESDVKIHQVIGHLLEGLGFKPPQNMDESTFERDIYETLMAKFIEVGAKDEEEPVMDIPEEDDAETNPIIEEQPQMYASLEEVNAIADPKERKHASMLFSLQQQMRQQQEQAEKDRKKVEAQAEKDRKIAAAATFSILSSAKVKRDQRIERLVKALPVAKRDKLLAMASRPSAQLSLSEAGTVVDPIAESLEIFEAALEVGGGSKVVDILKGSSFSEEPHPRYGEMTPERADELVDSLVGPKK